MQLSPWQRTPVGSWKQRNRTRSPLEGLPGPSCRPRLQWAARQSVTAATGPPHDAGQSGGRPGRGASSAVHALARPTFLGPAVPGAVLGTQTRASGAAAPPAGCSIQGVRQTVTRADTRRQLAGPGGQRTSARGGRPGCALPCRRLSSRHSPGQTVAGCPQQMGAPSPRQGPFQLTQHHLGAQPWGQDLPG